MHNTEKPKRIHLIGDGRHEEAHAAGTITPGHLVETDADGKVAVHGTAAGWAEKIVALEDALQGRSINDNYAADELVSLHICKSGEVVYGWLAGGETATPASYLTSNGDGTLKVAGSSDIRLFKALEAVDQSGSGDGPARIRVRAL